MKRGGGDFTHLLRERGGGQNPPFPPLAETPGGSIPVVGKIVAPVTYLDNQYQLPVYIIPGNYPALLGREWLSNIKLDWPNIFHVETDQDIAPSVKEFVYRFPEVFSDQGGPIEGFKANVHVNVDAQPKFMKSSPVPYATRQKGPQHSTIDIDVGDQETKFDSAPSSSTAPLPVGRSCRTIKPRKILDL
ncbi:hypothetical protein HOLleu_01469 [Holothuria leucospilota]|uniref:Uncharacterized protein n=1 Tax=Holothuria leucospilota TaxID=206669 RepID=A0A9Q1CQH2_HOLLE|nr:hypothetical protein HOLleu_01469 [Holothuria leucospilota]